LTVDDNDSLESLTVSSDKIETLTVKNNDNLTTLDFTGLTTFGEKGKPSVTINDNNLSATAENTEDDPTATAATTADFKANDKGSFTSTSGMSTLKTYLTAVAADADASAEVLFDTIESYIDEDDSETADITSGDNLIVLKLVAQVTTGSYEGETEKRAWLLDNSSIGAQKLIIKIDNQPVLYEQSSGTYPSAGISLTGNSALDKAAILNTLSTDRVTALGGTLDVKIAGNATTPAVVFSSSVSRASNQENYTDEQAAVLTGGDGEASEDVRITIHDLFELSVGGKAATASVSSYLTGTSAATQIATALERAWLAKYSIAGTVSGSLSFWTTSTSPSDGDDTIQALSLKSSGSGSRANGEVVKITWKQKATAAQISAASSGAATTTSIMDWKIGATDATTDNAAVGEALIISLEEVTEDAIDATVDGASLTWGGSAASTRVFELTTALIQNGSSAAATDTTSTIYPTDARGDVVTDEAGSEGTVTTEGVSKTRVHWL